jgi:hypothetical protein
MPRVLVAETVFLVEFGFLFNEELRAMPHFLVAENPLRTKLTTAAVGVGPKAQKGVINRL